MKEASEKKRNRTSVRHMSLKSDDRKIMKRVE